MKEGRAQAAGALPSGSRRLGGEDPAENIAQHTPGTHIRSDDPLAVKEETRRKLVASLVPHFGYYRVGVNKFFL